MSDVSVIFRLMAEDKTAAGLESAGNKFNETFKGIAEAAGLMEGFDFLKDAVTEADAASKIFAQTQNILDKTNGTLGISAQDVRELTERYGELAGVQGDQVQNALNFVMNTSQVQQAMANGSVSASDLTQQLLDLSAQMSKGGSTADSLSAASSALAKVMQDPFTASKALAAAGDALTASQVQQLAQYKKTGDAAGAYKLVLDSLKTATSGAAAANTTPLQQAEAKFADLKEEIGTKLLPTINNLANAFMKLSPYIIGVASIVVGLITFVAQNANVFGPLVAGIFAVVGAMKLWAVMEAILDALDPATWWLVGVVAIVAGVIYLADKFKGFRDFMADALMYVFVKMPTSVAKFAWDTFSALVTDLLGLASHIPIIGDKFKEAAAGVQSFTNQVDGAINAIQNFDAAAASDSLFDSLNNAFSVPTFTAPKFTAPSLGLDDPSLNPSSSSSPAAKVQSLLDKVTDSLNTFKSNIVQKFGSMGSVISNAMSGPPGSNFLIGNLQAQLAKAKQFVADISTLRKYGLNATSLNELIAAGPDQGADAARQLATTGLGSIGQVNSLETQLNTLGNNFANQTAKDEFGTSAAAVNRNKVYLNLDLSGVSNDALVTALRKAIRVKGGNVQTVLGGAS